MSIVIRGMAPAFPGVGGVKGNILTSLEILKMTLGIEPNLFGRRIVTAIEEKSGIKLRNVTDQSLKDPNTYLAAAAGHKLLRKLDLQPSQIEGFIFASGTPDYNFPPPGVPVMQSLGLNPQLDDYKAKACSSFISAVDEASHWIEKGRVNNVLVIACDITTRLNLPNNFVERLLFGDGAIAVLLEAGKPDDKGGFILTNSHSIGGASDLVQHKAHYSGDMQREFAASLPLPAVNGGNGHNGKAVNPADILFGDHHLNDDGYAILGSVDGREWAYILMDYIEKTGRMPDKIIPPQIGKTVILKGISVIKDRTGNDITCKVVDGSFEKHGNTGAAAHPIAWYEGIASNRIKSNESVALPFVPLGGRSGYFAYDPNLDQGFQYVKIEEHERVPRDDYGDVIRAKERKLANEKPRNERFLGKLGLPPITRPTEPLSDGQYVERVQGDLALLT